MSSARTEAEERALAGTVEVTMPETGSPDGARVIAWRRRPGELVDGDEPLCVVAWDGNTAEIDSPSAGVLRMIAVGAGHRATTGATLALIDVAVRVPEPEPEPEGELEELTAEIVPEVVEPAVEPEPVVEVEPPEADEPGPVAEIEPEPEPEPVVEIEPEPELEPEPVALPDPELILAEAERVLAAAEPPPEPEPEPVAEVEDAEPLPPADPVPDHLLRDAPIAAAEPLDPRTFLSPAVRRFVRDHDVDPAEVEGTGRGGRVTLEDVRARV